ncbi:MAG: NAD(P)/FAD-dependent oxidoreductase, partial [Pirellulales bacterium]
MSLHHVIIGGGPVATNAIETIRQLETAASRITLISDEPAHSRMALPYWLSGQMPREQAITADASTFQRLAVDARIGSRVTAIDPNRRCVTLDDSQTLAFDRLLIATGASPRDLAIAGADLPAVQPLWGLDDTQRMLEATGRIGRPRIVMIGAGFIGLIMLAAMQKRGWQLTVVEQADHLLPRMLDTKAAKLAEEWLAAKEIELHCGTTVTSIDENKDGTQRLSLANGLRLDADRVVVATGIEPNIELARKAGIATETGILVDTTMQTSASHLFAGGDVAQGPVLFSRKRAIHAIHPTAVDHGRVAGANMAGHGVNYPGSLSMNVLDACGLQLASFGAWSDDKAETTTIFHPDGYVYRRLVWSDDQIRGAIFVGRAHDMGMLTDVGMIKGIIQTGTRLGKWKTYLEGHPFDVRRAYVATGVAAHLARTTLIGRPAVPRQPRSG